MVNPQWRHGRRSTAGHWCAGTRARGRPPTRGTCSSPWVRRASSVTRRRDKGCAVSDTRPCRGWLRPPPHHLGAMPMSRLSLVATQFCSPADRVHIDTDETTAARLGSFSDAPNRGRVAMATRLEIGHAEFRRFTHASLHRRVLRRLRDGNGRRPGEGTGAPRELRHRHGGDPRRAREHPAGTARRRPSASSSSLR